MVSFEPNEEQRLIRDMARDFAERELRPGAARRDAEGVFPLVELEKLAELGLMGVNVPEAYGGAEAGPVAYALAITELAKACASTAVTVAVTNMVAEVIATYGTEGQKQRFIPKITDGSAVAGAFGLSEPQCGSDPASLATRARRTNDGWVLNGSKQWITSGDHADVMVVWARSNDLPGSKGISTFLVDGGTPGLDVGRHEDKMGLRGSSTVPLTFEDCHIPADALLGEEGRGFPVAMTALDGGRIGVASQALGIGLAALSEGVAYAKERRTFGKRIGDHQGVGFQLADSDAELEAARLLIFRAALLKSQKKAFSTQAAMAKLYASEAANRACYRSLQVHGGYGYTKEYPIERLYRDVRVTSIYEGTSEIQRLVIARALTSA